ncbi:MAG TPA: hypothetical protein PJ997_03155 [Candidatus Paceibacterota bacterium]|nr:hypothetical protein [Candidatus Paceibacterota bacterium]HMP19303.1 hypothetical protein [Candidatus Paceibacterota bacterium]HMP85615.1 hypothetical protein [Candidatus Paceibacterota bacterium]
MSEKIPTAPSVHGTSDPSINSIEILPNDLEKIISTITKYLREKFNFGDEILFIENQKLAEGILEFLNKKYKTLTTSLSKIGFREDQIPQFDDDLALMKTAIFLLQKNSEEIKNKSELEKLALSGEALEIVSQNYGVDVTKIISQSDLVEKNEPAQLHIQDGVDIKDLSDESTKIIQKKILLDLYIHGRSLNDLGGMYVFGKEMNQEEASRNLALSAVFHLINFKTTLGMFSDGNFDDINRITKDNPNTMAQMGRMEMEESETSFRIKGMTPNELSHESVKALLEYVMLDSMPDKKFVDPKEAEKIKILTEEPANEILSGIIGPVLSQKFDSAFRTILQDNLNTKKLSQILDLPKDKLNSPLAHLRFVKLFSLLELGEIIEQYKSIINTSTFTPSLIHNLPKK